MSLLDAARLDRAISRCDSIVMEGRVLRATPALVEASLPKVAVGTTCEIRVDARRSVAAEVVGFDGGVALLMPFGDMHGVAEGARVLPRSSASEVAVGPALVGRVVDPWMRPIDGLPSPVLGRRAPLIAEPPPPMSRRRILSPLPTGVRALDLLLPLGEGQRLGVFAGPGVGKSVLLGMLARHTSAERIVVALVGERGREVREFVERDLGPDGLARATVVVATADQPPVARVRAAHAAMALAEHERAMGRRVLLLFDSLTRYCMALREIGLAAREPPTARGYPPSVFAALPRLLERAGNDEGRGSISAVYTVLAEGDDLSDPVADASRGALDGHVVLSRKLAGAGHFPAIDVLDSVSRLATEILPSDHLDAARVTRELLSAAREARDLVEVGAYVPGSNPLVDRALALEKPLSLLLRQRPEDRANAGEALALLRAVLARPTPPPAIGGARG